MPIGETKHLGRQAGDELIRKFRLAQCARPFGDIEEHMRTALGQGNAADLREGT